MSTVRVEYEDADGWHEIPTGVYSGDPIRIRRGTASRSTTADPGQCTLWLANQDGRWSSLPAGTPFRVWTLGPQPHLLVPDVAGARAITTTAPPVPTDLDVRVELALDRLPAQLPPGTTAGTPWQQDWQTVMAQYAGPDQYAWMLVINGNGGISLRWSETGTATFLAGQVADAIPYVSEQRAAIRATLQTDNGAGGWTMRGYYAPTLAGPWRLLGEVHGDTPTEVAQSTSGVELGDVAGSGYSPGAGGFYAAEVRDGIDGDLITSPDFTAAEPGATQVTDAQGVVWDIEGGAEITRWYRRFFGYTEAPASSWGVGGRNVKAQVVAWGSLQPLRGASRPVRSTLARRIPSYGPLAYWPMEEGRGATQAASPIPGVQPMRADDLDFGSDSTLPGSAPLPAIRDSSRIHGFVPPPDTAQTSWSTEFLAAFSQAPDSRSTVMRYLGTGTVTVWSLQLGPGSSARVLGEDGEGAAVVDITITLVGNEQVHDGTWNRWQFSAEQVADEVSWTMRWVDVGDDSVSWTDSYTGTVGRIRVAQSPSETYNNALATAGMRMGHVSVFSPMNLTAYNFADHGYTGEHAAARLRRLAEEERLPLSVPGLPSETASMGPQPIASKLGILEDAAAADGGVLAELRGTRGLRYHPRALLINRPVALTLPYGKLSELGKPTNTGLYNDITVDRSSGSSARAVLEEGPLSVEDPPAGAGPIETSATVNVESDLQLEPVAYWLLWLATWTGDRYPSVKVYLHEQDDATVQAFLDRVDVQARMQVPGLPTWLLPQTAAADLIVEGYEEIIRARAHEITLNTSPAGPWTAGEIAADDPADDQAPVHIDTDGSELVAGVDADDTLVPVLATAGPEWCTTAGPAPTAFDGDLPFDVRVGGEEMTVTAVQPLLWDTYDDRTVPSGWGSEQGALGLPWQLSGGATADRSVALGTARVSLPDTSAIRFQYLAAAVTDCEVLTSVIVPALATGGSLRAGIVMRISGSSYYQLRVVFSTSGSVGLDILNSGSITDSISAVGQQYTAGSTWWVRARVVGHTVYGKAWLANTPEPGWQISDTITSGTISSGYVGVTAARASSNSNSNPIFQFDDWRLLRPQYFTVERAANGVAEAHAAGDDVRLARPMIIAL